MSKLVVFVQIGENAKNAKKGSKKGQKWPTNQRLNNSILVQKFYYLYGHFEHIFVTTRDQKLPFFWHFSCFLDPPHFRKLPKSGVLTKIAKTPIYYRAFRIFAKPPVFSKISKDDSLLAHKNVFLVYSGYLYFKLTNFACYSILQNRFAVSYISL